MLLLVTFTVACLLISSSHTQFTPRSWEEARQLADAAVAQMTADEKLGIVTGTGITSRCVGDTTAVSRLGIPSLCLNDGPAGVRLSKGVTGFPTGINVASTFSRRLMRARGVALGEEFRGRGIHMYLGPAMDLMRNPKAGRGWESFGPDPYLSGEGAFETITGVQSVGVQACAKHLVANNQEHWRYGLNANVDDRTMHEMYFYPFLRSIEANVSAVMCAYNQVNETSSCHNANMLGPSGLLRQNGFQGLIVSDWGATHDSASDNANAGLDMEQPGDWIVIGGGVFSGGLESAVNSGDVTEARFDQMVSNILTSWYQLGQDSGYPPVNFDSQNPDGSGSLNLNISVRSDAHTALVREIGSASAVLLKNNLTTTSAGTSGMRGLPVSLSNIQTIAIVGQDALMPNQDCNSLNECNDGTMSIGWGSGSNSLEFIVPPIDAITSFVGNSATITSSSTNDVNSGVSAAEGADVAFVFANAMSGELGFYDIVDGNEGDRNDIQLWWEEGSLIEAVAAVCNNTIAIVHSVGPVDLSWSDHPNITGIIYAGAPGEQTGPSLVDVLFGNYNPRGRLPFSISNNESDYGTVIVYSSIPIGFPNITYTEQLLLDYRYMDAMNITPLFEFGFGLSYTTFSYSSLQITTTSGTSQAAVTVTFAVTNTGAVDGTEIAQLYLVYPEGAGEPSKVLRGFEEVDVSVGESESVSIMLSEREISVWDVVSQAWVRPSGTFTVYVGASIKDIRLTGTF